MHLIRLNSPKNWKIPKKQKKWVTRPSPGAHPLGRCVPITLVLRDLLGYAETKREVKKILHNKDVLVNNKVIRDHKYAVGLMDLVEVKKQNKYFLVLLDEKGYFILKEINKDKVTSRTSKIINKKYLKKGKIQINLDNGNNILLKDKKEDKFKIGDSLILDLKTGKILKHLKLEKGVTVYLFDGKHKGCKGIVEEIINKQTKEDIIIVKMGKDTTQTLKKYALAIEDKLI